MNLGQIKFVLAIVCLESAIIILFIEFVNYNDEANPKNSLNLTYPFKISNYQDSVYQDVQIMVFLALGFLHVSLKNYGYSALRITMILGIIGIQWAIICRGVLHHAADGKIQIGIPTLINADFATASVFISVGAVLRIASRLQLIAICLIEICFYVLNEFIVIELFKIVDIGGSIYIHAFAAYFGLSLSKILRKKDLSSMAERPLSQSPDEPDLITLFGTLLLWIYWPSFNGILASHADSRQRAVLNTLLSLSASVVFTVIVSVLVSEERKISLNHLQNGTLAGGAAIGGVADLMIKPFGALMIGSMAGIISTLGYIYLTPFLENFNLHLHGMMGILGAISSAIMAVIASEADYGKRLYIQYPARAPVQNSKFLYIDSEIGFIKPGSGRSAEIQALYQLAALFVSLAVAITGGCFTGLFLKLPIFGHLAKQKYFEDSYLFVIPKVKEAKQSYLTGRISPIDIEAT